MKAVFFDFFGVVSVSDYWNDVYRLREQNGQLQEMDYLAEEMNAGRMTWEKFCAEIAENLGVDKAEVERRYLKQDINAEVVAYARSLKGRYGVYLASNAYHSFLTGVIAETGLDGVFDELFISSDLGVTKPHPLFYQKLLTATGVEAEECVFVDDIASNVDAARDAGMKGVLFTDTKSVLKELTHILTNN